MMYFTPSHEWIQMDKAVKIGIVGITDYAQKELGEIVFIELPKVGQEVKYGQEVCVLESTKSAADVYAPIGGKIIAINEHLKSNPSAINKSSESAAWLFKLEISDASELETLLTHEQYKDLIL